MYVWLHQKTNVGVWHRVFYVEMRHFVLRLWRGARGNPNLCASIFYYTPYNNITEILLKVALNNITLTPSYKSVYITISEFAAFQYTDLIFVRFKAGFRFFYSGFYRCDSFFIVYSILPIADFRFFVVLVKSGLNISLEYMINLSTLCKYFVFHPRKTLDNNENFRRMNFDCWCVFDFNLFSYGARNNS